MEDKFDITVEMDKDATIQILKDSYKREVKTNKNLKHIIITLILSFTFIICFGFGAFCWYESQFEYTADATETTVYTEGDSANAEYNDVKGDQYNDNAVNGKDDK